MFRRPVLQIGMVCALVFAMGAIDHTNAYGDVSHPASQGNHCVVLVEPLLPGQTQSVSELLGCYATFPEAIAQATNGVVRLPPSASSAEVIQALLETDGSIISPTVVGTHWDEEIRGKGRTISYTTDNAQGCYDDSIYIHSDMNEYGWNDIVSSAQGYKGCEKFYHFEHTYGGGSIHTCTPYCPWMYEMNNKASSWQLNK